MRLPEQLRKSDPLADVDVEALVEHPLFDELCAVIVSDEPVGPSGQSLDLMSGSFETRPHRSRRVHGALTAAAVVVVLAGTLFAVLRSRGSRDITTTSFQAARVLGSGPSAASPSGPSSSWQLVSHVVVTGWQQDVSSGPPPGQLTCPSTSACYALSGQYASARGSSPLLSESLYVSHDFGLTWSVLPMPKGFQPSTRLSCANDANCAAAGSLKGRTVFVRTTDGGHQWTVAPFMSGAGSLFDLSCTSPTTCHALLENVERPTAATKAAAPLGVPAATESLVATNDGGLSWTSRPLPPNEDVRTLACTGPSSCLVLGIRTDMARVPLVEKLEKAAVTLRLAIDHALQIGNESIQLPQYPLPERFRGPVAALPAAISRYERTVADLHLPAAEAKDVAAIVREADAMKHDLALNAVGKLPVNQWNDHGSALSTAQQTLEAQLGPQPFVRRTVDGGQTWTQHPLPVTDLGNSLLSCSDASVCATVGSPHTTPDVLVTSDGGRTWQVRTIATDIPGLQLSGVACPTERTCWATGSDAVKSVVGNAHDSDSALIVGTTDGGRSWSAVPLKVPANAPNYEGQSYQEIGPITCPRKNACLALGVVAQGSPSTPVYRLFGTS